MRNKFYALILAAAGMTMASSGAIGSVVLTPTNSDFEPASLLTPAFTLGLPAYCTPGNLVTPALVSPYSQTVGIQTQIGSLESDVYRNPGTGKLTFVYKDTNSAQGTEAVHRITLSSLWITNGTLNITDNGADQSGTSVSGATAGNIGWTNGDPRTIFWDGPQKQLDLQFQNAVVGGGSAGTVLNPGNVSARIFFETDATNYTTSNAGVIDGVTANASYYGPSVPEPSGLLLLGVFGIAGIVRRRGRKSGEERNHHAVSTN